MSIHCEIVEFGAEVEEAYGRLFTDAGQHKSWELLAWRYMHNPHGKGTFAVARDNGKIVGMIALVATRLRINGQVVSGIQAVDTIVAPEAQGKALFIRMGKAIYDQATLHEGQILWGFPNALAKRGWFGRLGWTRFGTVPFLVKPIRTGFFLSRIGEPLGKIDFPIGGLLGKKPAGFEIIERFGDDALPVCSHFNSINTCALDYSPAFLNWRLIDCPHTEYRVVGIRHPHGHLSAVVASIILDKHGTKIAYIMEAIAVPDGARSLRQLLAWELRNARRLGATLALGWNPNHSPTAKMMKGVGFIPLPDRFRPVEIHFGAKILDGHVPASALSGDLWYLSYINSDTV